MDSKDLIIRTERNVIDIVLSSEKEIKSLRREFEDFRNETRQEFKNVRQEMAEEFKNVRQEMKDGFTALSHQQDIFASELRGLNRTVDTMTTIFGWGFALVAIAVAVAPMLREIFIYRQARRDDEELNRRIEDAVRRILNER